VIMKIVVIQFIYGGVAPAAAFSQLQLANHCGVNRIPLVLSPYGGDALISRSRSRVLSRFLAEKKGDVLLMLDHDIQFAPEDAVGVCELAVREQCVAAAGYPWRTASKAGWGGRLPTGKLPIVGQDEVVDATYLGSGFMAVSIVAAEKTLAACLNHADANMKLTACDEPVGSPQKTFWDFFRCFVHKQADGRNEYLSEDWAFCERARFAGVPIRLWLKPQLRHYGDHGFVLPNQPPVVVPEKPKEEPVPA